MRPPLSTVFPLLLSLALASPASAQDLSAAPAAPLVVPVGFDQVVYKGLLGNVLDGVPMDPSDRLSLQRTNAVVSNTFLGRSLAVLAGLSNPVLLLGGFAWGVWAATNIRAAEAELKLAVDAVRSGDGIAAAERMASLPKLSPNADGATARATAEPVLASANSAADSDLSAHARPHVFKIWLPQRSSPSLQ
jgi:hypothetical protein